MFLRQNHSPTKIFSWLSATKPQVTQFLKVKILKKGPFELIQSKLTAFKSFLILLY